MSQSGRPELWQKLFLTVLYRVGMASTIRRAAHLAVLRTGKPDVKLVVAATLAGVTQPYQSPPSPVPGPA
jgi:hypothetical protein